MKSLCMLGAGRVELVEVPEPVAGPGQVLIATSMSAICGSELHSFRGHGQERGNSGHEGAGWVTAVGEGVDSAWLGQRVGACAVVGCGDCDECRQGHQTWCRNRGGGGNMHAEAFVSAVQGCRRLDDDMPWEVAVLLTGDGMGVPYHSSTKLDPARDQNIAIFGAGPIGLGSVIMQVHLGRRVFVVEPSAWRREAALRLGAEVVIDPTAEPVTQQLRVLTCDFGPDVCLEAAGRPETLLAALDAVRSGGLVVLNGEQGEVPLSPSDHFIRRDITVAGSWFYQDCEYPAMVEHWRNGLPVADLMTHRLPPERCQEAWDLFATGQTGKVGLVWRTQAPV